MTPLQTIGNTIINKFGVEGRIKPHKISDSKEYKTIITTLTDCITLLTQSGSNTKAQVVEKLKGLIE